MDRYKINYKTNAKINMWVVFSNMLMCFSLGILLFAVCALVLSFTTIDSDMAMIYPAIGSAVLSAVGFTVLTVIYARSSKDAEISGDKLIINFGFYEAGRGGLAEFHKKINLNEISACTVESEHKKINSFKFFMLGYSNSVYDKTVWETTAGQYSQPFLKIVIGDNILLLPVENAEELCSEINEKICK